jgi:hypothetical protein
MSNLPWRPFQNCRPPTSLSDFDVWVSTRRLLDDGHSPERVIKIMLDIDQRLKCPRGKAWVTRKVKRNCRLPDLAGVIAELI